MTQETRRKYIIDLLKVDGQVRVSQLSTKLNTSEVTIRNDLAELEKEGLLERIHGGAVQTLKNYYALDYNKRLEQRKEEKLQIAKSISELIVDGDSIVINSGSTNYYIAQELKHKKDLKIITHSIQIAEELTEVPGFEVVLLGGMISYQYLYTYGDDALMQLSRYQVDKAILSADGVDLERGLTTYHHEVAELARQMMLHARRRITVADHTKLGHAAFARIVDLNEVDMLVTDNKAETGKLKRLDKLGIHVVCPGFKPSGNLYNIQRKAL